MKIDLSGRWNYSGNGSSGTVSVPSAYDFTGKVVFDRQFHVNADDLDKYQFHIVCYGINHAADISVNGEFVTSHAGGYTSFVQPLQRNVLQVGAENQIRIAVSNELDPKRTIPLRPQVWGYRNYGGITRDIFLLATPLLYIRDVTVQSVVAPNGGTATVIAKALIEGPDPSQGSVPGIMPGVLGFTFEVIDKISGMSVGHGDLVPFGRQGEAWQEPEARMILENPKLWSPDSPELYLVKCSIVTSSGKEVSVVDEFDAACGIRAIALRDGDIFLNGKRLILRGLVWYEDHPNWGSALPYEQMERDVVLMKNVGANVVRFAGHPPHPYMLNLCDRYGMLAMEELPVTAPSKLLGEDSYMELAAVMMKEMVLRDRNHPSVLAWGVGDEFDPTTAGSRRFVEAVVRQAKASDQRPTYYGSRLLEGDQCLDLVDFAAVSVYAANTKEFKAQAEEWKAHHKDQPVIVVKTGSEVQQENRNGYSDRFSQQAQARFFIQRFDILRTLDYDGGFVWAFNDWTGDRPALTVNSGDPWLHSMGIVSGAREKRLAYDAVRSIFHAERFVALPAGTATTSAPIIYVLTGFIILLVLAYLYNANRRFRESVNRSLMNSYNFFSDVRDQHVVSVLHSTVLGLIVCVAIAIVASSMLLHFRDSLFLDNLLSFILVADSLKVVVVKLIWNPLRFIPAVAAMLFLWLLLATVIVLGLKALMKTRVYGFHAYTITMWSTAPFIILIPVGMILYRVMESDVYIIPALLLIAGLAVWTFIRFLKGISIIFDIHPVKVYMVGVGVSIVLGGLLYLYYDAAHSAPMYLSYMYQMLVSAR